MSRWWPCGFHLTYKGLNQSSVIIAVNHYESTSHVLPENKMWHLVLFCYLLCNHPSYISPHTHTQQQQHTTQCTVECKITQTKWCNAMHTKFEKSYLNGDRCNDITMFATKIFRLCSHTRHTANHTLTTVHESDKFTYIYIKNMVHVLSF